MIIGTQSNAPLTAEDLRLFQLAGFDGFKAMWHADPQEIRALRDLGADHFVVRLPDSRQPDGTYSSPEAYATTCHVVIQKFVGVGVTEYQVDNEPNFLWDRRDYGPWQYQWWMRRVIQHLRNYLPPLPPIRLIAPPLSFAPSLWQHGALNFTPYILDEWLAAYAHTSAGEVPSLCQLFDAVSAHPYWQSERQMRDPSFGGCFQVMHESSGGMSVVALEWGNSLVHAGKSLEEARAAMQAQYPQWLAWAGEFDYLEGAYQFLLGGTSDWEGFRLTEDIARSIRAIH